MINLYECGICKNYEGDRRGLRKHLKEEHFKKRELTNFKNVKDKHKKQPWWKVKEFK